PGAALSSRCPVYCSLISLIVRHGHDYVLSRCAARVCARNRNGVNAPRTLAKPFGPELYMMGIHNDPVGFLIVRRLVAGNAQSACRGAVRGTGVADDDVHELMVGRPE